MPVLPYLYGNTVFAFLDTLVNQILGIVYYSVGFGRQATITRPCKRYSAPIIPRILPKPYILDLPDRQCH